MPETVPCNLCGSASTRLLYRRRDYRFRTDDVQWSVVRCSSCGLGYLNPRPTREEIGRYYPSSYFGKRAADIDRYRRLARYVDGPPGRLLDVGTADGHFLEVMRDRGWEVTGVEPGGSRDPDDDRGLDIRYGGFPDAATDLPSGSFDVITAWAVFEHLHDPRQAFHECARLLRPGGRLLLEVPNLRSPASRLPLKEDVPRHLYFYDARTLRSFGEKAQLTLTSVEHTTDLFSGSGRGALRYLLVRASGGSMDDFFEMLYSSRRQRFRRRPVLATAWTATAALEHILLADWLIRTLRISGEIVVELKRT